MYSTSFYGTVLWDVVSGEMGGIWMIQWNENKAVLWTGVYSYHYNSQPCLRALLQMINLAPRLSVTVGVNTALGWFWWNSGASVSLKAAPAQLPGADAAVPGLFSVKQPGLLAFKRALHVLHHPWEEIKTIFGQSHLLLNQTNLKWASTESYQQFQPSHLRLCASLSCFNVSQAHHTSWSCLLILVFQCSLIKTSQTHINLI